MKIYITKTFGLIFGPSFKEIDPWLQSLCEDKPETEYYFKIVGYAGDRNVITITVEVFELDASKNILVPPTYLGNNPRFFGAFEKGDISS